MRVKDLSIGDVIERSCGCRYRVSALAPLRVAHTLSCNGALIQDNEKFDTLGSYPLQFKRLDPLVAALEVRFAG